MLKTFKEWIADRGIALPEGDTIPGSWFADNNLPMVVACTCCDSTMCVVGAHIDEEGHIYCNSCISED